MAQSATDSCVAPVAGRPGNRSVLVEFDRASLQAVSTRQQDSLKVTQRRHRRRATVLEGPDSLDRGHGSGLISGESAIAQKIGSWV